MTVHEFDSFLFSLVKNLPSGPSVPPGFLRGFRTAIWLVRKFIRENL